MSSNKGKKNVPRQRRAHYHSEDSAELCMSQPCSSGAGEEYARCVTPPMHYLSDSDAPPHMSISDVSETDRPQSQKRPASSAASGSRKRYQVKAKCFLLTFPQCLAPPEIMWERVQCRWPEASWAIVCHEKHQDGSDHMHMILAFKEQMRFNSPYWADVITPDQKHGNYQGIKNGKAHLQRAIKYVMKDGNYQIFGEMSQAELDKMITPTKKGESQVWLKFVAEVEKGATLEGLATHETWKGFIAANFRKVRDYFDFRSCMDTGTQYKFSHISTSILSEDRSEHFMTFLNWFNTGQHVGNRDRPIRAAQLWVIAEFGSGKTTFVRELSKYLRIYVIPPHEDFYCTWDDKKYDIAVLDEFHGQKQINWLNSWLDGSLFPLKRKGAFMYTKKFNVPTLIFSNFTPQVAYSKAEEVRPGSLGPLLDRLCLLTLTKEEIRSMKIEKKEEVAEQV